MIDLIKRIIIIRMIERARMDKPYIITEKDILVLNAELVLEDIDGAIKAFYVYLHVKDKRDCFRKKLSLYTTCNLYSNELWSQPYHECFIRICGHDLLCFRVSSVKEAKRAKTLIIKEIMESFFIPSMKYNHVYDFLVNVVLYRLDKYRLLDAVRD